MSRSGFAKGFGNSVICQRAVQVRDQEKPGAKEGGGADLALLCPPRTAVTLDTSMGTETEAIQSSPRFFPGLPSSSMGGTAAIDSRRGRAPQPKAKCGAFAETEAGDEKGAKDFGSRGAGE